MKRIILITTISLLASASPAIAGPHCPDGCSDGDGVADAVDNCIDRYNPNQDDTDGDSCGNLCDADYGQDGTVGFPDFGAFTANFGTANQLYMHVEPIDSPGRVVGFPDFGFFTANFGSTPGPSGPTPGTLACP